MRASAFSITACEDIVLGIEEEETSFVAELLEEGAKGLGFVAGEAGLTGICDDSDVFERGVACFEGFEKVGEEREREVVNAEIAAVFEGFGSDAFSRAAHAGNNHKVANHRNNLRLCGRQNGCVAVGCCADLVEVGVGWFGIGFSWFRDGCLVGAWWSICLRRIVVP